MSGYVATEGDYKEFIVLQPYGACAPRKAVYRMRDNSGGIHMTLRKHPKPTNRRQPRPIKLTPFDPVRYLKSDAAIAEYLNEALRIQDPKFLLVALGDVARARGMSEIARDTGLGRENLYKALSSRANPRIETIFRVAAALGVRFEVRVA